jgi:hypothetical protein
MVSVFRTQDTREVTMDGVYYTIAGVIVLMPWGSLGLTLAGFLRGRRARLST